MSRTFKDRPYWVQCNDKTIQRTEKHYHAPYFKYKKVFQPITLKEWEEKGKELSFFPYIYPLWQDDDGYYIRIKVLDCFYEPVCDIDEPKDKTLSGCIHALPDYIKKYRYSYTSARKSGQRIHHSSMRRGVKNALTHYVQYANSGDDLDLYDEDFMLSDTDKKGALGTWD